MDRLQKAEVEKLIAPLRGFGTTHGEHIGVQPYTAWQQAFDPLLTRGARNYWKSHNFSQLSGGAYINFLTQEETDRIAFAYGATYSRLVALKKKYDPTNLFRMNQNIKPV